LELGRRQPVDAALLASQLLGLLRRLFQRHLLARAVRFGRHLPSFRLRAASRCFRRSFAASFFALLALAFLLLVFAFALGCFLRACCFACWLLGRCFLRRLLLHLL